MPTCFDSHQARYKSQDFKVWDVICASNAPSKHPLIIKNRKGENCRFINAEAYALNPTFEAIKKADKLFPGCDLYIISLGTGELPRQFGDTSQDNYDHAAYFTNNAQDRHQHFIQEQEGAKNRAGSKIDYCRIQVQIDSSIDGKNALRQAGLSVSNPNNSTKGLCDIFEKATQELKLAYWERSTLIKSITPSKLKSDYYYHLNGSIVKLLNVKMECMLDTHHEKGRGDLGYPVYTLKSNDEGWQIWELKGDNHNGYVIRNVKMKAILEDCCSKRTDDVGYAVYTCDLKGIKSQRWKFKGDNERGYIIKNLGTKRVLDTHHDTEDESMGYAVYTLEWNGNTYQRWKLLCDS